MTIRYILISSIIFGLLSPIKAEKKSIKFQTVGEINATPDTGFNLLKSCL